MKTRVRVLAATGRARNRRGELLHQELGRTWLFSSLLVDEKRRRKDKRFRLADCVLCVCCACLCVVYFLRKWASITAASLLPRWMDGILLLMTRCERFIRVLKSTCSMYRQPAAASPVSRGRKEEGRKVQSAWGRRFIYIFELSTTHYIYKKRGAGCLWCVSAWFGHANPPSQPVREAGRQARAMMPHCLPPTRRGRGNKIPRSLHSVAVSAF